MSDSGTDAVVTLILSFIDWMDGNSDCEIVEPMDRYGHMISPSDGEVERLIRRWLTEEKEG